jgi:hypothetical protein
VASGINDQMDSESYSPAFDGGTTWESIVDLTGASTTVISGNDTAGYHTTTNGTESGYTTQSGSEIDEVFGWGGVTGLPESDSGWNLLGVMTNEQSAEDQLDVYYSSGSLYLYDSGVGSDHPYEVPHSVPAYLTGSTPNLGAAPLAALITGSGSNSTFGFVPSTNAITAHGLPIEKADDLSDLALNYGPTDGVSQTSTSPPTSVLVTLAAAGRNPTDILIPTQAGTEGSGGGDEDDDVESATTSSDAAGTESGSSPTGTAETTTTVVAASQPQQANGELQAEGEGSAQGSHLSPTWEGVKAFGASIWGNTGGALYKSYVTRGQKLGAGYGAVASNTTPADLSLVAKQRAYLTQQLMDPNRQTAADETTVAQYRAADAQITGNFLRERAQDAKAVSEALVAGVELAVDTYMIVDGGIAVKRAAGTLRAKAIERAAARTAATDGAPLGEAAAEGLAPKSPAVFENQFPNHVIEPPRQVYQPWQLKNMQGRTLNYVVTEDGELIIGRIDRAPGGGHIDLAGGRPVQAAGEVVVRNGEIKYLDNAAGHYLPQGPAAQEAAEQAFRNAGFDPAGKYVEKVYDP